MFRVCRLALDERTAPLLMVVVWSRVFYPPHAVCRVEGGGRRGRVEKREERQDAIGGCASLALAPEPPMPPTPRLP